ncbi:class I SAM-dependent methyltransferase [Pareuzebyella sediminis]|uniref:class I SAM-dependent methyltransferase n=1 Tax=Pareuzebyella sediminis TaxID=2607998 RepID=UPI0011EF1AA6|nr:class I SAM-dependent methyltransferase [Pareuzebyella sediminis]
MMDSKIKKSWNTNAEEWIRVIEGEQIGSRRFTNQAILRVIGQLPAKRLLDVGCGEGWLTRSLTALGKTAVGMDATETLLAHARNQGSEQYYQVTYEALMEGQRLNEAPFDAAVFNYSIYQKEGLPLLLQQVRNHLTENGQLIIQTVHPFFLVQQNLGYTSQMIEDAWKGLPGNFSEGHAWYARTLEDWVAVIIEAGMHLRDLVEVKDHEERPVSLILRAS